MEVTYSMGDKTITVEMNPSFGKRPELYIGEGNQWVKVASFGSEEKAKKFEEQLRYFFKPMMEGQ